MSGLVLGLVREDGLPLSIGPYLRQELEKSKVASMFTTSATIGSAVTQNISKLSLYQNIDENTRRIVSRIGESLPKSIGKRAAVVGLSWGDDLESLRKLPLRG